MEILKTLQKFADKYEDFRFWQILWALFGDLETDRFYEESYDSLKIIKDTLKECHPELYNEIKKDIKMIKRLTLTNEHITLIRLLNFQENDFDSTIVVNKKDPYMLGGRLEDLALALGYMNTAIPGTENDAEGAAFPDDVEEHILEVHHYVVDNLHDIETLIHQFVFSGGLTAGTYKCIDTEEIWEKE